MIRAFRPAALVAALMLTGVAPALAAPPDAARVRAASQEFEAGARAFQLKDYELAASHFEAADAAVPSAKSLRLAMRARSEAGHGSRAATHAAQALARYPNDANVVKIARETLEKTGPLLHKVSISCASPCVLAVGTRAIPGEATTRWTVYLDPGSHTVGASFFGDSRGVQREVVATAGGSNAIRFEPDEAASVTPAKASRSAEKPLAPVTAITEPPPAAPDSAGSGGSGLHPAFFIGGIVATAAVGGVTIWSGIDTRNDPGPDGVRQACAGQGTTCPEYQDGLAKELRTNVLIGATAGAGALTLIVGIFLTDWGGDDPAASGAAGSAPRRRGASATSAKPAALLPSVTIADGGGTAGVVGRF